MKRPLSQPEHGTVPTLPPDLTSGTMVHFYRAVVSHADVWRQRMDATTNWAAATTAAMVTFAFGDPGAPHVVLLLALSFDVIFLVMESRRYQTYDLWRRRFRTLNHYFIAPTLDSGAGPNEAEIRENLALLAADLGRTVPHLGIVEAVGYRIRRNYGFLFLLILAAWLLKLEMHPTSAGSWAAMIERAGVGITPGAWVAGTVAALALLGLVLALRAPSERMLAWTALPTPAGSLMSGWRRTSARSAQRGANEGAPE